MKHSKSKFTFQKQQWKHTKVECKTWCVMWIMYFGGWWHAHIGLTILIKKSLWSEIFIFPVHRYNFFQKGFFILFNENNKNHINWHMKEAWRFHVNMCRLVYFSPVVMGNVIYSVIILENVGIFTIMLFPRDTGHSYN